MFFLFLLFNLPVPVLLFLEFREFITAHLLLLSQPPLNFQLLNLPPFVLNLLPECPLGFLIIFDFLELFLLANPIALLLGHLLLDLQHFCGAGFLLRRLLRP